MNQEEFQRKLHARRVEIDQAYAAMTIPEAAREDIRREAFFYRSTEVDAGPGPMLDPIRMAFNEGKRALWLQVEKRIKRAREGVESPTAALSATAERGDG